MPQDFETSFDDFGHPQRTRVLFGAGAVDRLGECARELGATRVFVVTDPGIVRAGHVEHAERALASAGCEIRHFDTVHENPTTDDVAACVDAASDYDVELFVGVGGGSSIDVAKGCNLVRAGGGTMEDYHGLGKAKGTLLPLIAVPTTAGTGTEMQSFALIARTDTHAKMACGDPQVAPKIAVLDPALTVTQPREVTACTGLDALAHAVETAVTTKRNPVSDRFAAAAFAAIQASLPRVLERPDDIDARGPMLCAAAWGGAAIENSMLGAAHSMANPLTAHYDVPHGQAVGIALPYVVRFNAADASVASVYATLARGAGLCATAASDADALAAFVARIEQLIDATGFGTTFAAYGVPASAAEDLAAEAAQQWTAQFNPRPITAVDFRTLFELSCA